MEGFFTNLIISLFLSICGILLFKYLWFKEEDYYLPRQQDSNFTMTNSRMSAQSGMSQNSRYSQLTYDLASLPSTSLWQYFRGIYYVLRGNTPDPLIRRYGFESYFYLRFISKMAWIALLQYILSALLTLLFDLLMDGGIDSSLLNLIGYDREDKHSGREILNFNTMIQAVMTLLFSYQCQQLIHELRQEIKLRFTAAQYTGDEHNLIFRTALTNLKFPEKITPREVLSYCRELNIRGVGKRKICAAMGAPENEKITEMFLDIHISRIFFYHPIAKIYGFFCFW